MTTCVSGGTCISRSNLRLGASEGESDALFGKGSGSNGRLGSCNPLSPCGRYHRKLAEQAVTLETVDPDRQYLSDNVWRRHHMRWLQVRGAADDLARIAGRPLEQHIDGGANRSLVEGRLLAVDQFLKPHQSLVHVCR